jgi:hypothetical protein
LGHATASGFNGVGYFDCLHDDLIRSDRTRYQSNLNLPFKVAAKRSPSGYMTDCHLRPEAIRRRVELALKAKAGK